MNELNILLVDDDVVDVQTVQRALRRRGIANPVHVARDGVEALDLLLGREGCAALSAPRLILLDLNMPRMDGIEFLTELRRHPEHEEDPVFVLTTSDDDRHRAEAHALGVSGYIVKDDLPLSALDLVIQGLQLVPAAEILSLDVGRMVQRVLRQLDPDNRFDLFLPPSVLLLETAAARLERVFRCLLENVIEHHDQPRGRISVTWDEYDDLVSFRVQDDGPGIPPERSRTVFRPLYSTKPPAEGPMAGGQGMGLPLAAHIVNSAGGTIAAQGSMGRGATISFTWPTEWITPAEVSLTSLSPLEEEEPTAERALARSAPAPASPEAPTGGKRADLAFELLVVSDQASVQAALRRALQRRGHGARFHAVATADEALGQLRGTPSRPALAPAILLIDLGMPGRTGFALVEALRADPHLAGLTVFALTEGREPGDRKRAAHLQVAGVIERQDVGPDFSAFVDLLEAYSRIVRP